MGNRPGWTKIHEGLQGSGWGQGRAAGGAWGPRRGPLSPGTRDGQQAGLGEAQLGWVLGAGPRWATRWGTFLACVRVGDGEEPEARGTGLSTRAGAPRGSPKGPLPSPDTRTLQRGRRGGRDASFRSPLGGSSFVPWGPGLSQERPWHRCLRTNRGEHCDPRWAQGQSGGHRAPRPSPGLPSASHSSGPAPSRPALTP